NIGYSSLIFCALFCTYFIEKTGIYTRGRFVFTCVFSGLIIVFFIVFFIDFNSTQKFTWVLWPAFIVFFLNYLIKFSRKMQNRQKIIAGFLKFVSGFILMAIGFMMSTDVLLDAFGLIIRLFGAILQLVGITIIAIFFLTLPPFIELDWQAKIEQLFIIHKSGVCLYYFYFKQREQMTDEHLVSGAISSINIMLKEMVESREREISIIDKKNKTVLFVPMEFITVVMFCSENITSIKRRLKEFSQKFEILYRNLLEDWNGEITEFQSAENVVREYFQSK
ncbi:MAG: hypothetical protein Q6373_014765, partial [Candidatus Sigynarchaeota archaeon]